MSRAMLFLLGVAVLLGSTVSPIHGELLLRFNADEYQLSSGEIQNVRVMLDSPDPTELAELTNRGLFSMAFQVTFDPSKAAVAAAGTPAESIGLPDDLNDDGTGRPPLIEVAPGRVRIRAALATIAPDVYRGEDRGQGVELWLASIPITALGDEPFTLNLELLRSGPNDQVFIDGLGNVLDEELVFGSAQVVVPEPSTAVVLGLLSVAGAGAGLRRRESILS